MQRLLEKIYYKLPLFIQNIGISAFGWHWYQRRFGGIFKSELKKCKDREFYTKEQWDEYQLNLLRKLLLHSFQTVPYYTSLFKSLNLNEKDLLGFEQADLKKIPLLEKETFRNLGQTELLSNNLESKGEFYASSGSTGTPTKTLYSLRMHQTYYAIFESRINNWAGIDYKVPRGVIGGRRIIRDGDSNPPFYRYNFIEKQAYFSAYHISAKTTPDYLKGMVKHEVEYMTGYASANFFLARFIEESGLKAPKLKAVLTSSEQLTQEMRDTFRRVYGCETFDSYNGVECCNLISECENGKLHIVPDVGIVEVLNANGEPCNLGEVGEVISTGLLNFDQPLIRYRMGDYVRLSLDQTCRCGRSMPVVDEILGRIEDTVVGLDGREMVRFHGIFINISEIIESQIIQLETDQFEVKLVVSGELSSYNCQLIKDRVCSQLGNVQVKITIVPFIPRNSNGKFKAVISLVKRDKRVQTMLND